jgi:hypothetical protein
LKQETSAAVAARIDEIDRRYAELSAQQSKTAFEIEEAIKVASHQYLETSSLAGAKVVHELETHVDMISRSMRILEKRKAEAEKDLKRAQAAEQRQRAEQLREEAAGLEKKSAKLIDELSRIQDVRFDRSILESGRVGTWLTSQGGMKPAGPYDGPSDVFAEPSPANRGMYATSRAKRLLDEAAELDQKAETLDELELSDGEPETAWKQSA